MKKLLLKLGAAAAALLLLCAPCHAAAGYRIAEKDGRIALWDCGSSCWAEITDVPVSSLPEADRSRLHRGIPAATAAEAAALLEDYCG